MWYWLSNSKVRVGLLVNGLYLLSLILPSPAQVGGRPFAHTYERPGSETSGRPARRTPVVISLPPPAGPTKATSHRDKVSGSVTVYLDKDLTLLKARGHQLVLSPTFSLRRDDSPDSVLLHFMSYSRERTLSIDNKLSITADGQQVWPVYSIDGDVTWKGWKEETVPPFVTEADDGGVIENVGKTIPYEVFAKAISARSVVVNLGPHAVELKAEQLEALRDMHRLWSDSRAAASRPRQF